MVAVAGLVGIALIAIILLDVFETIVLPRRVLRRFRLTRLFYSAVWRPWRAVAAGLPGGTLRSGLLGTFGPLSLLLLLGTWVVGLIVGYGVLLFIWGEPLAASHGSQGLGAALYMSGTTFFTLGIGDVVPVVGVARVLTVLEVGTGFSVLALVIGYLPVLYQAFSQREVNVSLLASRAGSPPSAGTLLGRYGHPDDAEAITSFFREWERWAAEVMEGHLSYPVLAFYRSQHENQSWVSSLTTILDASALLLAGIPDVPRRNAELAFITARHAAIDLARIFNVSPAIPHPDRLNPATWARLQAELARNGVYLATGAEQRLADLRTQYEPYVNALALFLLLPLPPWVAPPAADPWKVLSDLR